MSTFRIRPARAEDAPALVGLRDAVFPYLVRGVAATRRLLVTPPPGEERVTFVAEQENGGDLVGAATAHRSPRAAEPGFGHLSLLHVHPGHRRRGIGDALVAAAVRHLRGIGVRRAAVTAKPAALDFARRHGFEPVRELRYSALELTPGRLPSEVLLPTGLRLAPVGTLTDDVLYQADRMATGDEPGDVPSVPVSYEAWRYDVWDDPGLDRDLSTAVLEGAAVVSFSLLHRDGDRAWSDMTATVPTHRGRHLALAAKSAAMRRAATVGVRTAYTANDGTNRPMLAVNQRLGYRPVATQWSCVGTL
jgi:GNAT superfamily N-acetyltransferase